MLLFFLMSSCFLFIKKTNYLFILAVLDLCCCVQAFSSGGRGSSLVAVPGLLTAVTPLIAEHGPYSVGSRVAAHRLSYLAACGILPDQGSAGGLSTWTTRTVPLTLLLKNNFQVKNKDYNLKVQMTVFFSTNKVLLFIYFFKSFFFIYFY